MTAKLLGVKLSTQNDSDVDRAIRKLLADKQREPRTQGEVMDTNADGIIIKDHGQQVDSDEDRARKELEARYGAGNVHTRDEAQKLYTFVGFCAPFVVVERVSDGQKGSLEFTHSPRFYFNFVPDRR